jgi:hypothetical protein
MSEKISLDSSGLNKYFQLPLGGIGKHFNTDIPTVAIPGGSAMMIKYVFV